MTTHIQQWDMKVVHPNYQDVALDAGYVSEENMLQWLNQQLE